MVHFTKNISLFCLDELHPGGNKYYKLKYNVEAARRQGASRLLSFGGPWSNHIHALAQMGHSMGFETVGVIRGEKPAVLSPTLVEAEALGMTLHFVSRKAYSGKSEPAFLSALRSSFGDFYLLPEGGTNELAVQGAAEILVDLRQFQPDFDRIIVPFATGGTMAGIARGLIGSQSVIGICVLKGSREMQLASEAQVAGLIAAHENASPGQNWHIDHRFHCGGYAKCPSYLQTFILQTEQEIGYPLEPVYSGKMMWAIAQMIEAGEINKDEKIVAIHTGGLQGRRGFASLLARGASTGATPSQLPGNHI